MNIEYGFQQLLYYSACSFGRICDTTSLVVIYFFIDSAATALMSHAASAVVTGNSKSICKLLLHSESLPWFPC